MGLVSTLRFVLQHPLNRQKPIMAVARFVRWQVASRIAGAPIAMPYVNGTRLLVSRGMTGATGNIYVGLHEYPDMAFVGHYLRPGDLFIDVGANVGAYSILAASCGAEVVAYEPVASTFHALDLNVRLNGFEARVSRRNCGVSDIRGALSFTTAFDSVNHVAAGAEAGQTIEVVRLDDEALTADQCMLKIDVEGFETHVIDGAERLLKSGRVAAVVLELNGSSARYGVSDDDLDRRMRLLGFRSYEYDAAARSLVERPRRTNGNTLYVCDLARVADRVRCGPPLKVLGADV
jgi:FkbM family methyltransferase